MSGCSIATPLPASTPSTRRSRPRARGRWRRETGRRFKVVANLPYHVATPVITNLLVHPELCPALLVVTIQRELADRLCARPSSPAYGAVSVLVQALADVSIVRALPPTVFWPRPKVDSAVVAIRPDRREASRRRRRRLVSRSGPAGFPPSPQVSAPRPGGDLARAVDQGRRRSPGSSRRDSADSSAPRPCTSRTSWLWPMLFASASVSCRAA